MINNNADLKSTNSSTVNYQFFPLGFNPTNSLDDHHGINKTCMSSSLNGARQATTCNRAGIGSNYFEDELGNIAFDQWVLAQND